MRKRGGWVDIRPNDKMQQYDALRDPHLRAMHEGERVKKHLNKMKQRELEERRNPETEAKLAWRKDVHELYGQPIGIIKNSKTPPAKKDPPKRKVNKVKEPTAKQNLSISSPGNRSAMSGSSRQTSSSSSSRSRSDSSYEMVSRPNAADIASSATVTPRDEPVTGKDNNDKSESSCEYSEDEYSDSSQLQQPQQPTPTSLDIKGIVSKLRRTIEPDYSAKGLNKPVAITDNIYLSCVRGARNVKILTELGIDLVLNCAPSQCRTSQSTYEGTNIKYHEIQATDEEGYKLLDIHFDEVEQLVKSSSGKVLIHCFQGVNRSATFVVALLMSQNNIDLFKAASTVHSKRPVVLQGNDSFLEQLVHLADKLSLLKVPDEG
eukprot:TRINITY_DN1367_c13_g1_i1.p1 TRINITY_DN1367_c13_g1~~TRINITY_DN1367_c13_g1_i1.p1  ORF type:complete len:376 (+),score=71.55 TRINITY_DN1367_c13_g1_i1:58-1185(+)